MEEGPESGECREGGWQAAQGSSAKVGDDGESSYLNDRQEASKERSWLIAATRMACRPKRWQWTDATRWPGSDLQPTTYPLHKNECRVEGSRGPN